MHAARTLARLLAAAVVAGALVAGQAGAALPYRENVRHVANVPGSTGGHVVVEGDRMYVGAYGIGMRAFSLANPAAPVEIGRYVPGPRAGAADPDPGVRADAVPDAAVWGGRHIVSLGGTSRTAGAQQTEFLDWTDPANPRLLWRFEDGTDGEAHNGDIVDARKLWLPSGGNVGLRIYDMSPLLEATPRAPVKLSSNNPVSLWQNSPYRRGRPVGSPFSTSIHDIEVYVDREVLLPQASWVDSDGDGVADPTYAKRDIALLAEGGSYTSTTGNTGSFFIIDITDPRKPVALSRFQRTAASGRMIRYFHEAQFLQGQPDIVVLTDEDLHSGCEAGGATIVRVSPDLTTVTELSQWFMGTGTPAPVCSAHVLSTFGNHFAMGGYNAGLQIVDLSDPTKPKRGGQYIIPGMNSWGALAHGGYIYVGDFGARGLDVFQFVPDATAQGLVASNPSTTSVSGVNETACENGRADAPTVDALMVPIAAAARDGNARIDALGDSTLPYNLNVYFYDGSCALMSGNSLTAGASDESGRVPEGAHHAAIPNVLGAPVYVYARVLPGGMPPVDDEG